MTPSELVNKQIFIIIAEAFQRPNAITTLSKFVNQAIDMIAEALRRPNAIYTLILYSHIISNDSNLQYIFIQEA